MLIKLQKINSSLIRITKNSFSTERLKSRSKLDKRQYRIINNLKKNNVKSQKNYNSINNNSSKNKSVNISRSSSIPDNNINEILKDKMPYIPNKERQKSETNFINLINALINSKKRNINYKNIVNINHNNIPYRPKAYNCYEYIRCHPFIINEDDDNIYSKIVFDLQKKTDTDKNNNNSNNIQSNERRKILNKLSKVNDMKINIRATEGNKSRLNESILSKSYKCLNTINNNINIKCDDISKDDKAIHKTIDYDNNNENKKSSILPPISNNKKDYKQSDIFYLINNSLSKNKSSEKYLFKENYLPPKIENEKKTSINDVGWSPKNQSNKSRIGCSSVAFNILSPSLKNFSPMKKDIDLLNKNSFEKAPLMSGYIDICKPGDTSLRQDFSEKFNENKNIFHKKNYCAAYNDLHHEYKDLINDVF